MEEWLSVAQISKTLEIPETTTRRYLNNFEEYFRAEQLGRGKKYHPSAIEILQRVAMLYDSDRETIEIRKILADEYAFELEDTNNDTATQPPAYDIPGKLDEFQRKQDEFNKKLLEKLQEQQQYIQELASHRDAAVKELKRLSSPDEKRADRFDQIMTERKVKRVLEKEALKLWDEKPEEARFKKTGLFRKEEDKDKRDLFIEDYIDEHFEAYLKNEFEI